MKFLILALSFIATLPAFSAPVELIFTEHKQALHTYAGPVIKNGTFSQRLDHFSADTRVFKQRYWSTDTYASGSAPVLLYICGESACGSGAVMGMLSAHAANLKARAIAVEHRYYGQSQPFTDLATENLKYLSTDQAIADLIYFKTVMQSQGYNGKWIVMGGSYAGALAADLRAQAPEHFVGALASSAAVRPLKDLTEYDHYLARIAGPDCVPDIQKVLNEVETEIVTDEGFTRTLKKFSVTNISRREDFIYLLADIASGALQFGLRDKFCQGLHEKGVSGYVATKAEVDKIQDLSLYSAEAAEKTELSRFTGAVAMRQWFYQSCTEYGFWQNASTDNSLRVRSTQINPEYHDRLCQRLFQMPAASEVDYIFKARYLPLLDATTSNIFFTNGSNDPWRPTQLIPSFATNPQTPMLTIEGASHCEDLYRGGTPAVMNAKARFQELAREWLTQKPVKK